MKGMKVVPKNHRPFLNKVCSFTHGEIKAVQIKKVKYVELEMQHKVCAAKENIAQIRCKVWYSRSLCSNAKQLVNTSNETLRL